MKIDNKLRDLAFNCAKKHGFHNEVHSDKYYLMLIITELSEVVEADRKGKHADNLYLLCCDLKDDNEFKHLFELKVKDSFEDELADIFIRCLDFCGAKNYNLDDFESIPIEPVGFIKNVAEEMFDFVSLLTNMVSEVKTPGDIEACMLLFMACIMGLSKQLRINLRLNIEYKMRYNDLRPMLNGKKY